MSNTLEVKGVPRKDAKDTLLPSFRITLKDKQGSSSLRAGSNIRTQAANEVCQISVQQYLGGFIQNEFSGRNNKMNKKALAVPGLERIYKKWVPESKFTSPNSKIEFFFF